MQIVEFTASSLRFADSLPDAAPADGFVWVYLDRTEFVRRQAELQAAAHELGAVEVDPDETVGRRGVGQAVGEAQAAGGEFDDLHQVTMGRQAGGVASK